MTISNTELRERLVRWQNVAEAALSNAKQGYSNNKDTAETAHACIDAATTILRLLDENEHGRGHHLAELKAGQVAFNNMRDERNRLRDENAALVKERDELREQLESLNRQIESYIEWQPREFRECQEENARLLKRIEALRAEVEEERRGTYCVAYNADAQSPAHKRACRVLAADDAMSEG